ncbi:MAG: nitroreductase family protein [Enterocloster sp.]
MEENRDGYGCGTESESTMAKGISSVIESRRSIRKYTDQKVGHDQIEEMVKAASLAPSAKNRQPWKYLVYEGEAKKELLSAMERGLEKEKKDHCLLPGSAFALPSAFQTLSIMQEAPVIIIVMDPDGKSPYEPVNSDERLAEICDSLSIGASIQNMLLKATELGLGTLWIANTCFAYNDMVEVIPSKGQLIGAVAVGYAAEKPHPKPRKKLEEILEYVRK